MERRLMTPALLGAVILFAAAFSGSLWKMFDFRDRLHDMTDNSRWERTVMQDVQERPILLFGDSEIALWPMASSFGAMPAINRGISGDWATKAIGRFKTEFDLASPRTTVILMGTNDIANGLTDEEIIASLVQMIEHANSHGSTVVICSILPASGEAAVTRPTHRIRAINQKLESVAATTGSRYVDLHSVVVDGAGGFQPEYTVDGLHPSRAGYVRMSHALLRTMLDTRLTQAP